MAVAVVGMLISVVSTETMVTYGQNDGQSNDPKNQACYNAGFGDGRQNHAYSQSMFNQCGINGQAYHQGFLSGCISGQGKDYFSCQRLTSGSDGNSNSGSDGNSNSGSDGNSNSGSN
jgi:hypothetical protein